MADITTTTSMDDMINSLKQSSLTVQELNSEVSLPLLGSELPPLRSMVFTPSILCSACKSILDRSDWTPRSATSSELASPIALASPCHGEIPHHSLENLAKEAVKGCRLCLIAYLGLDPDLLERFAGALQSRSSESQNDEISPAGQAAPLARNFGVASVISTSKDQAVLVFQYRKIEPEFRSDASQRSVINASPSITSSLVASFDIANFESQRASMGYYFQNNSGYNVSRSTLQFGGSSSRTTEVKALYVELTLLNPRRALELGVHSLSTRSACTASAESLEIARSWIRECKENHFERVDEVDANWKPTYLLDISVRDSDNIPGVRLVDGTSIDRDEEYATLSHSWGSSKPIQLHKGTESILRFGVTRAGLPKSLAQAAMVAEKLGFKYLWIDTLCVMHDDEAAVLGEAAQTDKIFGNAVVNIAATCAWSDTDGFIRPRNVTALQPCLLDVCGHGIDDGTYVVARSTAWDDLVERAPLQRRARLLQERGLAKRTLHFTRNELMWECQRMCCSEVYPKGIPEKLRYSQVSGNAQATSPMSPTFDKKLHHQQTGNWGRLVELYSIGKLNNQSDKLLAISGLARQYLFSNGLQESDYVVGLWKPDLPQSLLWSVDRGRRPSTYRAPTWSWASIDGQVRFLEVKHHTVQACLDVIDISMEHKYNDVYGVCLNAQLKVFGFLTRGIIQRKRHHWSRTSCCVQFPKARVKVDFHIADFDEALPQLPSGFIEVFIQPVISTPDAVQGLFLIATNTAGQFRRLGTWELPLDNNRTNCDRFRTAMKKGQGPGNCEEKILHDNESAWFAGNHKYTVTLV